MSSAIGVDMSSAGVEREEERMKVADTDVISRTVRMRWGVHGRMECHESEGEGAEGSLGWSDMSWIGLFAMSTVYLPYIFRNPKADLTVLSHAHRGAHPPLVELLTSFYLVCLGGL